jgi:hypothetical protein
MFKKQALLVVILAMGMTCLAVVADEPRLSTEMERLWSDPGTDDPAKADQTIRAFIAKPVETVAFFKSHLQPASAASRCKLARLLAGLDSDRFEERQIATRELERLAEQAEPVLRKVLADQPSPEAARRIQGVLDRLRTERLRPSPERRRAARAVEVLEQIGDQEARKALAALTRGSTGAQLTVEAKTALERLAKEPVRMP